MWAVGCVCVCECLGTEAMGTEAFNEVLASRTTQFAT